MNRPRFPHLAEEVKTHVPTAQAAFYLNRMSQTLRVWACYQNGPIRPVLVHGRLAWPVAEIRRLLQ
ncbi:DNA-binding protein [Caenimonas sedimenti]|uniref:DNA-binding protein n=1 Tax=Caenimonas sedimenti TaxID=2596921 RepID=A0A562ZP67_9BURK|nr:DNA-binding protein [Caenimonas sedimenti]